MRDLITGKNRWFNKRLFKQQMPPLGARELDVMKILWREEGVSAQQALQIIGNDAITLSTMQSTLERLHRKGLVERQKEGRLYLYNAAIGQSDMIRHLLQDMSMQISDGDMAPMISGFMDFIAEEAQTDEISSLSRTLRDNLGESDG